jgi:hypothetical protein
MKFLKLSKTSWLILSAGVFVVVLAGLGITRSQQMQEQGKLSQELGISQKSLDNLQVNDLKVRLDELQQRTEEAELQLDEARSRLDKTVVSVDVTDEFFSIAHYCGVIIMTMNNSPIKSTKFEGVGLQTTSLTATAYGDLDSILQFVMSLNNDFTTGLVRSFQIDINEDPDVLPTLSVQMVIYSYEGTNDG